MIEKLVFIFKIKTLEEKNLSKFTKFMNINFILLLIK